VPVSIGFGGVRQALDLGIGQILAGRNSAFGRRNGLATVRFTVAGDTNLSCDFTNSQQGRLSDKASAAGTNLGGCLPAAALGHRQSAESGGPL
jgi:hypothetical protein